MQLSSTASYGQASYSGNAGQEARSLLPLLRVAGQTVADVLDLIRVTPEEERGLAFGVSWDSRHERVALVAAILASH